MNNKNRSAIKATDPAPSRAKAPQSAPVGNPNVTPLAQDFVVVARTPSVASHFMHDPGMTRLPNGHLFVAAPARTRDLVHHKNFTFTSRSQDGGRTWQALGEIPFCDATPIVHEGELYLFGQYEQGGDWYVRHSADEGQSWSEPVLLFRGNYWNCSTSMVIHEGQLYWALGAGTPIFFHLVAIACDLAKGLLNPSSWRMSNVVTPPMPDVCTRFPRPEGNTWWGNWAHGLVCLEPNVVLVNGHLMLVARAGINNQSTASLAAVFDLTDQQGDLKLDFAQYYPVPGGQCKMYLLYDEQTHLFFMLSNLVTDSLDRFNNRDKLARLGFAGGPGNERRLLFLHYSVDALNWFPAGCVAKALGMRQSFMYPCAVIDGDDIALISRTSQQGLQQHDADLCTFHRIRNFRSLTTDLRAVYE